MESLTRINCLGVSNGTVGSGDCDIVWIPLYIVSFMKVPYFYKGRESKRQNLIVIKKE